MHPFSIACTTCKISLKVTNPKALGEILPCPKCGSMVLIPESNPHAPVEPAASAAVPTTASDSFDNIEHVLQDGTKTGDFLDTSNVTEHRWKSPPSDQANSGDSLDADSTLDADVSTPVPSATPTSSSAFLLKRVFMIGGGVTLGTALAIGIAFGLLRTKSDNQNAPQATTSVTPNDARQDDSNDSQQTQPDDPANLQDDAQALPEDDALADEASLVDEETDVEPSPLAGQVPPDPQPNDLGPDTVNHDDDRNGGEPNSGETDSGESNDPPPLVAAEDLNATEEAADANNEQVPDLFGTEDDLSDFANWLRDSSIQPKAPPKVEGTEPPKDAEPIDVVQIFETRPAPPNVDVDVRLKDKIPAIKLQATNISAVTRFLTGYSTIPISFEPDALAYKNVTPTKRLPSNIGTIVDSNVQEVLEKVLAKVRLDFEIVPGHIVVTTRSVKNQKASRYPHKVADLAETNEQLRRLAAIIEAFVAPNAWASNGGNAQVVVKDGAIEVFDVDLTHFRVLRFLDRVRLASRLPASRPNSFTIVHRLEQIQKRLPELISIRFARPLTFGEIATEIEEQVPGFTLLVDWQALQAAGWSPKDGVDFFCDNQQLVETLNALLLKKGLAWRAIDDSTIEITSQMSLLQRNEIEFYPVTANDLPSLQQRINRLAKRYPVSKFEVDTSFVKGYLILSAPQPVHRELSLEAAE